MWFDLSNHGDGVFGKQLKNIDTGFEILIIRPPFKAEGLQIVHGEHSMGSPHDGDWDILYKFEVADIRQSDIDSEKSDKLIIEDWAVRTFKYLKHQLNAKDLKDIPPPGVQTVKTLGGDVFEI